MVYCTLYNVHEFEVKDVKIVEKCILSHFNSFFLFSGIRPASETQTFLYDELMITQISPQIRLIIKLQ